MSAMEQHKRLVFSIIEYLKDQSVSGNITNEAAESLDVGIQCLETAYDLNTQDPSCIRKYKTDVALFDAFDLAADASLPSENSVLNTKEATAEEKQQATEFKTAGNEYMKDEKYTEALDAYTKAINLDQRNAVYYCNRAAALSKLNRNAESIDDCHRALTIDPSYSKAYGRMGIAHTALEEHSDAFECYRKACELDPDNETYRSNLHITEEKLKQNAAQSGMLGGGMSSLFSNPYIMNVATQMMRSPEVQEMMSNLVTDNANTGNPPDMRSFLDVGQQMATHMQQSHPELVEQLRNQFQTASATSNSTSNETGDGDPPPSS